MRRAGCVLVLGAIVGAACQRPPVGVPDGGAPADLALPSPADLAPPIALDLASWIGPDLQPPPETIAICPQDAQADTGTNSVVRVHASALIDHQSITPTSLVVQLGATPIAGSVSVTGADLVFEPTAPWPANATLQVSLAAGVRDTLGRPLAPAGKSWSFSTGAGAQPTNGFKFTPPVCPYLGDHAIDYAVARDGSQTIIAWSTSGDVVATSLTADATDFVKPRIVSHDDIGFDQISVAAVDGVATFAYTMTFNSSLVYWSRAQDDWMMPATEQLLSADAGGEPSVAVASGGLVAIAWEYGAIGDVDTTHLITSSDSGASFSAPTALDLGSYCPHVLYQNGRLVVVWLDSGTGTGPIKAMSSTDNGATFTAPVVVGQSGSCPQLVDGGNGDVLVLYEEGVGTDQESVMLGRYTPSSGAVGTASQLYGPDTASQCSHLAASPSGKLVLSHSRGSIGGATNWTTELRTSDDYGQTFSAPTSPDVIDALGACPSLTITDDEQVTMAWQRDSYQLQVSRGHPRRPCE